MSATAARTSSATVFHHASGYAGPIKPVAECTHGRFFAINVVVKRGVTTMDAMLCMDCGFARSGVALLPDWGSVMAAAYVQHGWNMHAGKRLLDLAEHVTGEARIGALNPEAEARYRRKEAA